MAGIPIWYSTKDFQNNTYKKCSPLKKNKKSLMEFMNVGLEVLPIPKDFQMEKECWHIPIRTVLKEHSRYWLKVILGFVHDVSNEKFEFVAHCIVVVRCRPSYFKKLDVSSYAPPPWVSVCQFSKKNLIGQELYNVPNFG